MWLGGDFEEFVCGLRCGGGYFVTDLRGYLRILYLLYLLIRLFLVSNEIIYGFKNYIRLNKFDL